MIEVHIGEAASYAAAGVDIDAGDAISQMWNETTEKTHANRSDMLGELAVLGKGSWGIRGFDLDMIQGHYGLILNGGVDGVGTKTELAERETQSRRVWDQIPKVSVSEEAREHSGIFQDMTAMVVDDISRDGGEPFGIATLFDIGTLKHEEAHEVVRQLTIGAVAACKTAGVVYFNGETAELGNRVGGNKGSFNYNLGGFALGVTHKSRALTGEKIKPGDSIVAFREHGFRANGMSLVRKVLAAKFGAKWHMEQPEIAEVALTPSIIYTPTFVDMHGGYDVEREPLVEDLHALIHVTGGGIPGKLQRKLAVTGYGAVLDNLFDPSEIMSLIQSWSLSVDKRKKLATPDASLYQSLNGGIGALSIGGDADKVIAIAAKHGVEAQVAGEVVKAPGIILTSKGVTHPGEQIKFTPKAA